MKSYLLVISLFILIALTPNLLRANTIEKEIISSSEFKNLIKESVSYVHLEESNITGKKINSVILAIMLGPFGVHRLYLGTEAKVPVIYTLTLGGGFGILPLIDIVSILVSRDISKYQNNNRVIMWNQQQ